MKTVHDFEDLGELTIKYYKTPEEIYLAFCPDLDKDLLKGTDFSKDFGIPYNKVLETLEDLGVWGFIDNEECIHVWADPGTDFLSLLQFFGHEIGHLLSSVLTDDDPEFVANSYGFAAKCAYNLTQRLLEFMTKFEEVDKESSPTSEVSGLIFLPEE